MRHVQTSQKEVIETIEWHHRQKINSIIFHDESLYS